MKERLFLSAGFSDFCVGWAQGEQWRYVRCRTEPIAERLFAALQPCMESICWEAVSIFLLNGPGSTLGIRTFCAFIRTLLVCKKIPASHVWVCDSLHFARLVLDRRPSSRPICARVQGMQIFCLGPKENTIHRASEAEKLQAVWLPHPCLPKNLPFFHFTEGEVLPLLQPKNLWCKTDAPDVFSAGTNFF